MQPNSKPVVLCILDGWGLASDPRYSAPDLAQTPEFDALMAACPHTTLTTFGPDVGLPRGQMGNSEVGHTNIGAGQVIAMDLGAINLAIEEGSFAHNAALCDFIAQVKHTGGTAHLMAVISDGGVHGHIDHLFAACRAITAQGLSVAVHAIADGRDTPPSSALGFLDRLEAELPEGARLATLTGRYWALDRDNRWERVAKAYNAIVHGVGAHSPCVDSTQTHAMSADDTGARDVGAADRAADVAPPSPLNDDEGAQTSRAHSSAHDAVRASYAAHHSDEFIPPTVLDGYSGARDGDGFFCLNFRADRAREIMAAIAQPDFEAFDTGVRPKWAAVLGMVSYSDAHDTYMSCAFAKRHIVNTLGEWVSKQGRRQFRLAETEKYPHVTFFLNGGRETPFEGEERFMPKSPNVATYDLQPQMSSTAVTDKLVETIYAGFDLIVVNYANPDMVGHTGHLDAAIAACEAVDRCLGRALAALRDVGGTMLVTADHGNCEQMWDPVAGEPHTSHTLNLVPLILYGGPSGAALRGGGRLADLAPTVLTLMGLPIPPEMTGQSLLT